MKAVRQDYHKLELRHYQGSLDFPCDFCGVNSYDNYQVLKDGDVEMVFCESCFKKVKDV